MSEGLGSQGFPLFSRDDTITIGVTLTAAEGSAFIPHSFAGSSIESMILALDLGPSTELGMTRICVLELVSP